MVSSKIRFVAPGVLLVMLTGCGMFQTTPDSISPGASLPLPVLRRPSEALKTLPASVLGAELSLAKAVILAAENSPTLRAASMRVDAARSRVLMSWSAYLPSAEVGMSASRMFESPSYVISLPGIPIQARRYSTYSTQLSMSLLIFDGFQRTYRRLGAEAGERESRALYEDARRLLARAVGSTFFGALLAEERVAIALEDHAFYERLVEEARKMLRVGRSSEADVLNYELRLSGAQSSLVDARNAVEVSRIALGELLGMAAGTVPNTVRLVPPPAKSFPEKDRDVDKLVEAALGNRPDLARAVFGLERSEAAVDEARGAFLPLLAGQVSAGHARRDTMKFSRHDLTVSGALSLSWKICEGGRRHAALRGAKAEAQAQRADVDRVVRAVASEVRRALASLDAQKRKAALDEANVDRSLRLRSMEERAFAAGVSSRITLDQAQRDHVVARTRAAISRISTGLARFELDVALAMPLTKKKGG